jgi:hypothetical protein
MASKINNDDDQWEAIYPAVMVEITHVQSGVTRKIKADSKWKGRVRAEWGHGVGVVEFDLATGHGCKANEYRTGAESWRLTVDAVRLLTGDNERTLREPKGPGERPPRPIKVDPRQVDWTVDEQ